MELITMSKGKVNVKVANTQYVKQFYNGLGYKIIDSNTSSDKEITEVINNKKETKNKKETTKKENKKIKVAQNEK